ncbi:signal peptide peptidase SppA [Marinilongibacter aquaticus]|uniref:signal peptide peptidase SppA n=1 Tax=Marinilongibacter aquaticus TaxID=2975157 RepID=UPI0021BCFB94|nr:signal peptide peptidase SppA [Marinilongibacter aquaticus]UBM57900.1 signal peptide peptidase SppA [Marinilongibacter aquaticus]
MLQFFKYVLATVAGLFVFAFFSFMIMIGIASVLAGGDSQVEVKPNSILKLDLNQQIIENAPTEDPLEMLFSSQNPKVGLVDLKAAIANAKLDPKIEGIYIRADYPMSGFSSLEELRAALVDFKSSGKFVYSYGDVMSEKAFYVNSMADRIFLPETGDIEFNGLAAEITFLKGLFEKIGVKPEIFRVGEFKSAVEPLIRTNMSEANKLQTTSYLNSIADDIYGQIAESRSISREELNVILNNPVGSVEEAKAKKLITDVAYFDEFEAALREKIGLDEDKKLEFVDLAEYRNAKKLVKEGDRKKRVAVILAQGDIVSGKGDSGSIGAQSFIDELRKSAEDDKVKAIVLRINSPGGSALASDLMWREIQLAKKKKPVYASMGDYAASGGYYMAMGCDTIVANPSTITGSIGIFGILLNTQELMNNKLGITFDAVETHEHANFASSVSPIPESERAMIQNSVNAGYERFTSKAALGRKMKLDDLKAIASGRVWTGTQAKENGLVDVLGNLNDAIELAAKRAGIEEDYSVRYYPKAKTDIERFLEKISGSADTKLKQKLGALAPYLDETNKLLEMDKVQARMLGDVEIQ